MSLKPSTTVKWATESASETRQGGVNKLEPTEELQNNGSLDGNFSLNHLNFMFNALGLWSQFENDMYEIANGSGVGLTKDDHSCIIFAFDVTNLDNYVLGFAHKPGTSVATTKIINNNVLTFGTPDINGDVPILGAVASDVKALSINFKTN